MNKAIQINKLEMKSVLKGELSLYHLRIKPNSNFNSCLPDYKTEIYTFCSIFKLNALKI